ncbi:2-oxo-4-hydroxy-4-carboxy-5-ureidoimidazoline decarboxylase [Pseudonocardia charpentierae]|uniref:2-oxo-4-hydroxy-4-carboxy-5-ureidoimidazoline decarboxylase n=1 Tax=Pseudonocardia charpentierae TaxID=3075545 RepID=A0ABU2N1Z3_9PSEU|nr:2-oxo-4-hydroxy-4-carboxy-5-ureidoimidazoline decarboxylase [Pseudonocardia sp. DSM 45834]MDT0347930.1 2-oxo-4-hydroxy-4-carboxy-5-ureidoimidazoline decarboxylase [Pseudonocardia sp. DSM 45834]
MTNTGRLDVLHLPDAQAAEQLRACNASPVWIEQVLAHRPYADLDSVLDTAEHAARDLDWSEVRRALDAHPRIGERAEGGSTEAQWSRREQSTVAGTDARTQELLRTRNAEYERRFGHVFLIRAAGRSAEEMLTELDRRLGNDEGRERAEVTEQLAQITRLRLQTLLAG